VVELQPEAPAGGRRAPGGEGSPGAGTGPARRRLRILHAADLHLDSPLRGLARYEGAPVEQLRGATRAAFDRLVEHALTEGIDLVLLVGDVWDGDWPDHQTGLWFVSRVARLAEAGVRVVFVRGNHDADSRLVRRLPWPPGVVELSTDAPETVVLDELGVAVHGQGYPKAAVTEDLARRYPPPVPGLFNIGLLHTALDGRPGHAPYAPTSLAALCAHGYDYWALGHVHQHEVLSRAPWVVFPGNLQGRHVRESGPKGCVRIELVDGAVASVRPVVLDVVRWARLAVDLDGLDSVDRVSARVQTALLEALAEAEGRTLAVRLELGGAVPAAMVQALEGEDFEVRLRAEARALSPSLWLEKLVRRVRPAVDAEALARRDDPLGALLRGLRDLAEDPEVLAELEAALAPLRHRLPHELRVPLLGPEGSSGVLGWMEAVERLLLPSLVDGEEA
jgi:exonuclease SbcD